MLDEITYPFPNFNGATVEVWEWISNFITHFTCICLLIHAGIKDNPYKFVKATMYIKAHLGAHWKQNNLKFNLTGAETRIFKGNLKIYCNR